MATDQNEQEDDPTELELWFIPDETTGRLTAKLMIENNDDDQYLIFKIRSNLKDQLTGWPDARGIIDPKSKVDTTITFDPKRGRRDLDGGKLKVCTTLSDVPLRERDEIIRFWQETQKADCAITNMVCKVENPVDALGSPHETLDPEVQDPEYENRYSVIKVEKTALVFCSVLVVATVTCIKLATDYIKKTWN